eukprot:4115346-Prymnesium_polylepis.1
MAVVMLTVTLAWAARHTTQACVTTTRTGTVRCNHHSDIDPADDNFVCFPSPPRSVINTKAQRDASATPSGARARGIVPRS